MFVQNELYLPFRVDELMKLCPHFWFFFRISKENSQI